MVKDEMREWTQKQQQEVETLQRLRKKQADILAQHPEADPDNVWHTLLLLEEPPLKRLERSLSRGRAHLHE